MQLLLLLLVFFFVQSEPNPVLEAELLPQKSVLNRAALCARISSSPRSAQMASAALIANASHSSPGCLTPSLILIRNAISTWALFKHDENKHFYGHGNVVWIVSSRDFRSLLERQLKTRHRGRLHSDCLPLCTNLYPFCKSTMNSTDDNTWRQIPG